MADAFDAMTTNRPYHEGRRGRPPGAAFAEVDKQAGRQFDPRCAAAFLDIRDQVVRTMIELMPDADLAAHAAAGAATVVGLTTTPPPGGYDSAISSEHPFI